MQASFVAAQHEAISHLEMILPRAEGVTFTATKWCEQVTEAAEALSDAYGIDVDSALKTNLRLASRVPPKKAPACANQGNSGFHC